MNHSHFYYPGFCSKKIEVIEITDFKREDSGDLKKNEHVFVNIIKKNY